VRVVAVPTGFGRFDVKCLRQRVEVVNEIRSSSRDLAHELGLQQAGAAGGIGAQEGVEKG